MNAAASGLAVIVGVALLLGRENPNDALRIWCIAFLFGFAVWSALDLLEAVGRRRK